MLTVAIAAVYFDQAACHWFGLYDIKLLAVRALYRYRKYNTLSKSVDRTA